MRVKDVSMTAVTGAQVSTDPPGEELVTDALGTVRFAHLAAGFYTVTAVQALVGSARLPVTVRAGLVNEITLTLRKASVGTSLDGGETTTDAGSAGDASPEAGVIDGTVTLDALDKDSGSIALSWSVAGSVTFSSFRVYRARNPADSFEVVGVLNAPSSLAYRDTSAQLGVTYRYRVGGVTVAGREIVSNVQTITAGVFIDVRSQVEAMKVDPTRPYLYAIDRVNNALHFVNLTNNTVESTIFVGSSPTDLDINVQRTELFVANFGSTEIAAVNLDSRTKSRSVFVDTTLGTWDGNPYRLACLAGDTLVFTSQDQWNDLKLVNAISGAHIATVGSLYEPSLARSADGTRLYASDDIDGVTRYNLVGNTLTVMDSSSNASTFGHVTPTRDGMYVFGGNKKRLATNLKSVLGIFSEGVLAASADGSVVVGPTSIANGTLFSTIKTLPLSTMVMALGPDDHTLYLYDTMTSRIYIYNI